MGNHIHHFWLSLCNRSCLIQNHYLHLMGSFQSLAALYQNSVAGSQSRSHHNCRGRCQSQGTGTGYHQNRYENSQHKGRIVSESSPDKGRRNRNPHNRRHKISCHRICKLGNGGFLALSVFHHLNNPGKSGIRPHMGYFNLHGPVKIHTAANYSVACFLFHRNALSRQHGFVHTAGSSCHRSVKRNLAARLYQKDITGNHFLHPYLYLLAVP